MHEDAILQADLDHILHHTPGIWEGFRGSRLFITGGTGFVGKWLLESFLHANKHLGLGAEAVVLSRNPASFAAAHPRLAGDPAIRMWPGDIRDFATPPGEFSHAIHGATDVAATATPLETFDVAVNGTRRVLDFCRDRGVPDLLLISSGAVYGRQPSDLERIGEGYPGAPASTDLRSAYGQGKRAAEWLATAYGAAGGPAVRIARCFAFVGPYLPLDSQFAVGNFLGDRLAGRPITLAGDGSPLRSYLYAADLARWLWVILARGSPGEAYNVGAEEAISIGELARRIASSGAGSLPVEIARPPRPDLPPERYIPSTRKAREALGLEALISLDQALARSLDWASSQHRAGPCPKV